MCVHPDLEHARQSAQAWRVKPSARGFNLWRFRPWASPDGGWRIAVADLKTREDAWLHALHRMGLMREPPPAPLAPVLVSASWIDPDWA